MNENENDPLPEILETDWSKDQTMVLFADLAAGAQVQHVQLRTPTQDRVVSLAEATAAYAADEARAIQVRYEFEGETWCDTIIPGDVSTKIIRVRTPNVA